jgi:hypothetical protein
MATIVLSRRRVPETGRVVDVGHVEDKLRSRLEDSLAKPSQLQDNGIGLRRETDVYQLV